MLVWAESAYQILIQDLITGLVEGHEAYWL
jgi:hypothetical protein